MNKSISFRSLVVAATSIMLLINSKVDASGLELGRESENENLPETLDLSIVDVDSHCPGSKTDGKLSSEHVVLCFGSPQNDGKSLLYHIDFLLLYIYIAEIFIVTLTVW